MVASLQQGCVEDVSPRILRRLTPPLEPRKGRHRPAQGNALGGAMTPRSPALKGHNLLRPFRATGLVLQAWSPRALPWAGLLRPFRAGDRGVIALPGRCPGLTCCAPSGLGVVAPFQTQSIALGWPVPLLAGLPSAQGVALGWPV